MFSVANYVPIPTQIALTMVNKQLCLRMGLYCHIVVTSLKTYPTYMLVIPSSVLWSCNSFPANRSNTGVASFCTLDTFNRSRVNVISWRIIIFNTHIKQTVPITIHTDICPTGRHIWKERVFSRPCRSSFQRYRPIQSVV